MSAAASNLPAPYTPSTAIKVIRWINCVALIILGGYSFIVELTNFTDPTRVVLCIYLTLFGVLGVMCELQLAIAARNFGFIMDDKGKIVYFLFIGTLGLSFGPYNDPMTKSIPFALGVFSCFASVAMIMDRWCRRAPSNNSTEMQPPAAGKYANAI